MVAHNVAGQLHPAMFQWLLTMLLANYIQQCFNGCSQCCWPTTSSNVSMVAHNVAGQLHPAMFQWLLTMLLANYIQQCFNGCSQCSWPTTSSNVSMVAHNAVKGNVRAICCIIQILSAEYWCPNRHKPFLPLLHS